MQLATFFYEPDSGWSTSVFPKVESTQLLVIVFGDTNFLDDPTALDELKTAYPQAHFMGCSTSGEIFDTVIRDGSLSVAVIEFERTELVSAAVGINAATDSFAAGEQLATQLNRPGLNNIFVLSDGIDVNGSELVRGLNAHLPPNVIVTGGLAGDKDRFERTWVLQDGVPKQQIITAVGFYGEHIKVGHGSKGGWDIFGPERQVTRSSSNILYELDGRPALELYKEYLGERADDLPASALLFPLALRSHRDDDKQIVRTILSIDEATQSMTFAGDVPEGYLAQLMKANFDRLIDGAAEAALITKESDRHEDDTPILSIAISCVGRRLVMGELTEEELEATLEALPENVQQIGFYSYGEISPYTTGACDLHNQTMTLTTIREV